MATTTTTTPALFRFSIHNTTQATHITHTHPIPLFLCQPAQSHLTNLAFQSAFLDTVSVVTAQHHTECMNLLTAPCLSCASPATDCLKAPSSFLNLSEPLVVINVYPVCHRQECSNRVRVSLLQQQKRGIEDANAEEGRIYGNMSCAVCGKEEGTKRCAGCGTVGYCGKQCQVEGWKAHKRYCQRRSKPTKEDGNVTSAVKLPYETI